MEAVTQLTGVETKSGNNGRGSWTGYFFTASDGQKYQTFDKALGGSLQQHLGGAALRLVYEDEQRGDFTNHVVKSFEIAGEGAVQAQPAAQSEPAQAAQAAQASSSTASAKDVQIHRQTAAKVGAELLQYFPPEEQTLATFNQVVDELVDFFNHGRA